MKRIRPSQLASELKKIGSLATRREMTVIMKKLSIDAFMELVRRSATDTGFLRSNWDVAVNRQPGNARLQNPLISGLSSVPGPSFPSVSIKAGDTVTLYNNTEYSIFLEKGTPRVRAQPMVLPTSLMLLGQAESLTEALSRKRAE